MLLPFTVLAFVVEVARAPYGCELTCNVLMQRTEGGSHASWSTHEAGASAAAAAVLAAAGATFAATQAACTAARRKRFRQTENGGASSSCSAAANKPGSIPAAIINSSGSELDSDELDEGKSKLSWSWRDSEDDDGEEHIGGRDAGSAVGGDISSEDSSDNDSDDAVEGTSCEIVRAGRSNKDARCAGGKLWTKAVFPEGMHGPANWDVANLRAAQQWQCPCADRISCISEDRVPLLHLYEYRKAFRTSAKGQNGYRDACRTELEAHYDEVSRSFARSFKVGSRVDCCAAAAGLAKGVSFATFASSRADCTKKRTMREGRRHLPLLAPSPTACKHSTIH